MTTFTNPFGINPNTQNSSFNQHNQPKQQQTFQNQQQNDPQDFFQITNQAKSVANLINSPMGEHFLKYGAGQMGSYIPQIQGDWLTEKVFNTGIRYYFDVDNRYVLQKLFMVIFPFKKSPKTDLLDYSNESNDNSLPPKQNITSADLYIPLMSIMTFILISCLSAGIGDDFQPEIIQTNMTKCLFVSVLETLLVKLGFFLIGVKDSGYLDLISYLNYRYVSLTVVLIFHLILDGGWAIFALLIYMLTALFFFTCKSLSRYQQDSASFGNDIKNIALKLVAALQIIFSFILLKITGAY